MCVGRSRRPDIILLIALVALLAIAAIILVLLGPERTSHLGPITTYLSLLNHCC